MSLRVENSLVMALEFVNCNDGCYFKMILKSIGSWSKHQRYFEIRKDLLIELLLSELPYDRETIFWHSFNSGRIVETATLTTCNILFMDLHGLESGRWTLFLIVKRITNGQITITWIVTCVSRCNINFTIHCASNMDLDVCKMCAWFSSKTLPAHALLAEY